MNLEESFDKALKAEIVRRIEAAITSELVDVEARVSRRVREQVGCIAATIVKRYSMETMRGELVIRVEFNDVPK